jgi:hypothetical protein
MAVASGCQSFASTPGAGFPWWTAAGCSPEMIKNLFLNFKWFKNCFYGVKVPLKRICLGFSWMVFGLIFLLYVEERSSEYLMDIKLLYNAADNWINE